MKLVYILAECDDRVESGNFKIYTTADKACTAAAKKLYEFSRSDDFLCETKEDEIIMRSSVQEIKEKYFNPKYLRDPGDEIDWYGDFVICMEIEN